MGVWLLGNVVFTTVGRGYLCGAGGMRICCFL